MNNRQSGTNLHGVCTAGFIKGKQAGCLAGCGLVGAVNRLHSYLNQTGGKIDRQTDRQAARQIDR